jgi:MinD-like ATPase involved in chromosome partitioning or flagellar assembly
VGVVTICSGKTAGVTTLAVAVAARWQPAAALLVEADPAGGDLAARFGLLPAPGLGSAAVSARNAPDPWGLAAGHTQRLAVGVEVLLAPASFVPASAAVQAVAASGLLTSAGRHGPVVVDIGRLDGDSPALPIAVGADVVLVVTRPRWDDIAHAAASIETLRSRGAQRLGLLVRAGGPLSSRQITDAVGVAVLAQVGEDRLGARVLGGQIPAGPGWRRLGLARTGRGVAETLLSRMPWLGTPTSQPTPPASR